MNTLAKHCKNSMKILTSLLYLIYAIQNVFIEVDHVQL